MHVTDVILSKEWRRDDGRRASIYGAAPWLSSSEKARWSMVTTGWTWKTSLGTVGLGRVPVATYQEAVEMAQRINDQRVAGYRSHMERVPSTRAVCEQRIAEIEKASRRFVGRMNQVA